MFASHVGIVALFGVSLAAPDGPPVPVLPEKDLAAVPLLRGGVIRPSAGDGTERRLLIERHNILWELIARERAYFATGCRGQSEFEAEMRQTFLRLRNLADVKCELSSGPDERADVLRQHAVACRTQEKWITERAIGGLVRAVCEDVARAARLYAEAEVVRIKAPAPRAKPITAWTDDGIDITPVSELHGLLIERHNALAQVVVKYRSLLKGGHIGPLEFEGFLGNTLDAIRWLADVRVELSNDPAGRVSACERGVAALKEIEAELERRTKDGLARSTQLDVVRAARLDMEVRLLRAKRAAAGRD